MSNIDKQAVQAVSDLKAGYTLGNADVAILNELARIALASLEAEPVAWIVHARTGDQLTADGGYVANAEGILGLHSTPLYTAPPAPVADLLLSELLGVAKRAADEADECAHAEFSDDSMEYSAAIADWERRSEMVKKSGHKNYYRDYEDYRDRLESVIFSIVRSMAGEEIRKDEVELHKLAVLYINDAKRRLLPSHVMTTEEKGDAWVMRARAISLRNDFWNGKITQYNSPVVQDGWVAVPVEPTKEMIVAGQDALDECICEGFSSDEDGNIHEYTNISSDAPHCVFMAMIESATIVKDK